MKGMIKYCLGIVILGVVGMVNERVEKMIYGYVFDEG